jgi:hypothetical protein
VPCLNQPRSSLSRQQTVKMPPPERMTAVAAEYGIDIIGPPGHPFLTGLESAWGFAAILAAARVSPGLGIHRFCANIFFE